MRAALGLSRSTLQTRLSAAFAFRKIKMNEFLANATVPLIPTVIAVTIGVFASVAVAQNYYTGEPGEAPGVSQTAQATAG